MQPPFPIPFGDNHHTISKRATIYINPANPPSTNLSPISTLFSNGSLSPSSGLSLPGCIPSVYPPQAMPEPGETPRRISHANAHRPPQHRRRVWRACESCRKKKVKCDGSDPCKPCLGYGLQCTYPEATPQQRNDGESSDMFDSRLRSLEDMVAKLVEVQSSQLQPQQRESLPPTIMQDEAPALNALNPSMGPTADLVDTEPMRLDELYSPDLQDLLLSSAIDPSFWPRLPQPAHVQTYADCFGQLEVDKYGETRYVGLGATVCIVDNCAGLRKRIQTGLANKGYDPQESVLDSSATSPAVNAASPIGWWAGELPPAGLIDALTDRYFSTIHVLFPIVCERAFRDRIQHLLPQHDNGGGSAQDESLSLLYAVLAVASPQLTPADPVYTLPDCWRYQGIDLGAHFFSLAVTSIRSLPASMTGSPTAALDGDLTQKPSRTGVLNTVMARALLSVYLTEMGMPREAWKMLSHAVRLGQDMGLHRSPRKFHLPSDQQTIRRRVWWCLYVMDRLLSMNLGRPLAIEDADCDVEMPSTAETTASFIAMIHLCQIIGRVLRVSNSVGNAARWRDPANHPELRATVDRFTVQLEEWADGHIRDVDTTGTPYFPNGAGIVERSVLQSCYFATVILLFRPLMSNPHRESPLGTQQAMRRCFEASMACIRLTEGYVRVATLSHYLVLHGQTLFICVILLMHCIRLTENEGTLQHAVEGCQRGIASLMGLEAVWIAARQCRAIAEEYLEFTLDVLERGKRGSCSFEHGHDPAPAQPVNPTLGALKRRLEDGPGEGEAKRRRETTTPSVYGGTASPRPCSFLLRTPTRR
ncbi:fungal-specific transcription factor domain-containing protein [Aspergillus ambiguus]|uniref:transcription factor domain-containing protein n=1 Tax=Aspergillus ambiguus TaxID=176160 RepID=UPI003CCD335A